MTKAGFVAALTVAAGLALPALAQKSADTARVDVTEPFPSLSTYDYSATEASFFNRSVMQMIVGYDERSSKFVPLIAKSWKRIDDKTLEFELYDDVKFDNGDRLTADDVITSVQYAADPSVKIQFKERYTWVDHIEKISPTTFRVVAKLLNATDLLHFAYRAPILDGTVLSKLEDKSEYGRKSPIGSGPLKITKYDRNTGVTFERSETFKPNPYERAPVKRIEAAFTPDQQTQIARLITGQTDLLFNISTENANGLRANPATRITTVDSLTGLYILLDAIGRSGKKELQDPRVRKAIFMAIDRDTLRRQVVPGGDVATPMNALCFDEMDTCGYTTKPPGYDPEGAKKLLADAGYPNGFDMVLDAQTYSRDIVQAVSGMLYKVGVRATVNTVNTLVMFKRWQDGETQALVNNAPAGVWPDASYILGINFSGTRDTAGDPAILKAMADGELTHDNAKRKEIYKTAFDHINQGFTHLPISSMPVLWAHSKDIKIDANPLSAKRSLASDLMWN
jgi:peptide/nickel transport system substrate-binding protein